MPQSPTLSPTGSIPHPFQTPRTLFVPNTPPHLSHAILAQLSILSGIAIQQIGSRQHPLGAVIMNACNALLLLHHPNGVDARYTNLAHSNFAGCVMKGALFHYSNLGGVDFGTSGICDCDFVGAQMSHTSFYRSSLSYTKLIGTQWKGANIEKSQLEAIDMRLVNAPRMELTDCHIRTSNLSYALFLQSIIRSCLVADSTCQYTSFNHSTIEKTTFKNVDFSHSQWHDTTLSECTFQNITVSNHPEHDIINLLFNQLPPMQQCKSIGFITMLLSQLTKAYNRSDQLNQSPLPHHATLLKRLQMHLTHLIHHPQLAPQWHESALNQIHTDPPPPLLIFPSLKLSAPPRFPIKKWASSLAL